MRVLRNELALRNNKRFLNTLTEVIPGLLSYWNRALICTFANKEYSTWFGRSREEMNGIKLQELLGDELFFRDELYIRSALNGHGVRFERDLRKVDGEIRHVWVNYMPDDDGTQIRGFYVLVTDVTELKQAQLELEETNKALQLRTEEAEQANRAKSRFLAMVAHEFRTPLSLLTSSTDILDRYGERLSEAENAQQHEHIRNAARQMARLVDSVLTFNPSASEKSCSLSEIEIGGFCRLLAHEVETACARGQKFRVCIADNCGTALLDEQLVRRIIENLLSNAFRYTAVDGYIVFTVSREHDSLKVTVSDSGIGIPEADRGRIFEAFYRCSNVETRSGLGLGLSIVSEALHRIGGRITVDSAVGCGTAMRVEIPVVL